MLIDTNVIVRFLVETPETIEKKFSGVFPFFSKIEKGDIQVRLLPLVLFQVFFVLTSYYNVPTDLAAEKLIDLISFKGIVMDDKTAIRQCLKALETRNIDLVDAYLAAYAQHKHIKGIYSFDNDLSKLGLSVMKAK